MPSHFSWTLLSNGGGCLSVCSGCVNFWERGTVEVTRIGAEEEEEEDEKKKICTVSD